MKIYNIKLPEITAKQYSAINTSQTLDLAKKAKQSDVKHFIFYSTVAVYGVHGYLGGQSSLLNEQSACKPVSAYAKSKWAAENALFKLENKQFRISVIRPPLIYSKGSTGNMTTLKNSLVYCLFYLLMM